MTQESSLSLAEESSSPRDDGEDDDSATWPKSADSSRLSEDASLSRRLRRGDGLFSSSTLAAESGSDTERAKDEGSVAPSTDGVEELDSDHASREWFVNDHDDPDDLDDLDGGDRRRDDDKLPNESESLGWDDHGNDSESDCDDEDDDNDNDGGGSEGDSGGSCSSIAATGAALACVPAAAAADT